MSTTCPHCNQTLEIGQYPFCPHGETRPEYAARFDPIALDRRKDPVTGEYTYSHPGSNSDPLEPGYERIHITTLREADRFSREQSKRINEESQFAVTQDRINWDAKTKERREAIDTEMTRRGITNSLLRDRVREYVDRKRETRYRRLLNRELHAGFQVFNYDASNRPGYSSPETGWRERK